jgi:hypothetical protein
MTRKPETPEEKWKAIVAFAEAPAPGDDELDLSEPTDEAVATGLAADGFDPDAIGRRGVLAVEKALRDQEEAEAKGHVAQAVPAEPASAPELDARKKRGSVVPIGVARVAPKALWSFKLIAAIAATIVIGGGVAYVLREPPPPRVPERPVETPAPKPPERSPLEVAWQLRKDAVMECDLGAWRECLAKLDEAKQLDPAGDESPIVKSQRETATSRLTMDAATRDAGPSK